MPRDALADRNIVIVEAKIQHYFLDIGHKFPSNLKTRNKKVSFEIAHIFCSYEIES